MSDAASLLGFQYRSAVLVLFLAPFFGCASGQSALLGELDEPLSRVLVVVEAIDGHDAALRDAQGMIVQQFRNRLIAAKSYELDELSLNPQEALAEEIRNYEADGVLILRQTQAYVTERRTKVDLVAVLLVPGSEEPIWRADMASGSFFTASGAGISDKLIQLLTRDGIL